MLFVRKRKITQKDDDNSGVPHHNRGRLDTSISNKETESSMRKTVLTFGLISGAILAVPMLATLPFVERIDFNKAHVFGYTLIVLSALLVFFGVRSYRENVANGQLTFGKALAVGILITLLSNLCYTAAWEVAYFKFMPDFADKYAAHMVERARSSGASQETIEKTEREAKQFKVMYDNPAINVAVTFMEVFPIFLGVTLLSAAILRKKAATATA
jgi:hypothetical protein